MTPFVTSRLGRTCFTDILGAGAMIVSGIFFVLMLSLPKYAVYKFHLSPYHAAFWPVLWAMLCSIPLYAAGGGKVSHDTERGNLRPWWVLLIVSKILPPFLLLALIRIPNGNFIAISFLLPACIALAARIFLRDLITRKSILALIFGFLGILLMERLGSGGNLLGYIFAFLYLLQASLSAIAVRALGKWWKIGRINMVAQVSMLVGTFFWATLDHRVTWPGLQMMTLFIMTGLLGVFSEVLFMKALTTGRLRVNLVLNYTILPVSIFVGYILFREHPGPWSMLGMLCIVLASAMALVPDGKKTAKEGKTLPWSRRGGV